MELTQGSVAVVTGAASGIGRAVAVALLDRGCQVVAADRDEQGLQALVAETGGDRLHIHPLDVSDREAMEAFAGSISERFERIDLLVNNAGVAQCQTVDTLDYADLEWVMQINFWGMVYGAKAFLPAMLEQGRGSIVFLSSIMGIIGAPTQAAYNASKFGIRGFAEALRQEVEEQGVEVLVVCPGGIRTNIIRNGRIHTWSDLVPGFTGDPVEDFERLARTTPDQAAGQILRAVERGKGRLLIGSDARWMDRMQRLFPDRYPAVLTRLMGLWARI